MFIAGGYHKTGSVLFEEILKKCNELHGNKLTYNFSNHFDRVPDKMVHNHRGIVLVRNPYEIICSGMRYHQITNEKWVHVHRPKWNTTYQKQLKSLSEENKLLFEMNHCAKDTIHAIYNDMKNRNANNTVLFIQIEELYDKAHLPDVCRRIAHHLNHNNSDPNNNIKCDKLLQAFRQKLKVNFHRTQAVNEYTYPKLFKERHYAEFKALFPEDVLQVFGYAAI
jgi:hypothetical protein